jgi:hypothetical protein
VLPHWNNSLRVDMSLHLDTLFWFQANQSFLFLLNAARLAEKQQIPMLFNCWIGVKQQSLNHSLKQSQIYYGASKIIQVFFINFFVLGLRIDGRIKVLRYQTVKYLFRRNMTSWFTVWYLFRRNMASWFTVWYLFRRNMASWFTVQSGTHSHLIEK